jgi:phosphoglycolate phosphatase
MVDLDGTLVDTLGDFVEALNRMLTDLPLPASTLQLTAALVEPMVGKGSEHLIDSALRHLLAALQGQASQADVAAQAFALYPDAWDSYQQHYLAINGQFSAVYPGAKEALTAWHGDGLAMACLTNKPLAFAKQLLAAKGLDGFFVRVFGGDSFARKKPDPLPLLSTCAALAVAPAQCLMVGDSSNDARAARAAGCPVALVSYGYNHGLPIDGVDADAHVDSLLELSPVRRSLKAGA